MLWHNWLLLMHTATFIIVCDKWLGNKKETKFMNNMNLKMATVELNPPFKCLFIHIWACMWDKSPNLYIYLYICELHVHYRVSFRRIHYRKMKIIQALLSKNISLIVACINTSNTMNWKNWKLVFLIHYCLYTSCFLGVNGSRLMGMSIGSTVVSFWI